MKKIILFTLILFSTLFFGQPGTMDLSFNSTDLGNSNGYLANSNVYSTKIQNDGKIIIVGNFTTYNGIVRNRIARLNTDGSLDTSFNPAIGANNVIYSTSIQNDGKIIIVGDFTSYNGTSRNRVARLNIDGSLDTTFNPGTGANLGVFKISIQSDGKIIICGYFTSYNGTSRNRIARLNTDGSLDTSFNPGTGADNDVSNISIQSDGKIIICGYFTSYNGTVRNRIARLNTDGSLDTSFNPSTGANNNIYSTAIQSDGKIIVGGVFNFFNGTSISCIARLNTNGSLDTSFNTGTGANSGVSNISIQNDGKIVIGGDFTSYNGTLRNRIARLNTDGSLDTSFNEGIGAFSPIYSSTIQSDGKIIVGGAFTSYNGTSRNYIARLNTVGSLDASFNPSTGANNYIRNSSIQNDGKIVIGGDFTSYNGTLINRIARLNTDGSLDTSFNLGFGANNFIFSTTIQSDGKIIIGGDFTSYNGTFRNRIARLNTDGSLDTTFNVGTGANNYVRKTSIQNDGKIIVVGDFTSIIYGAGRNRIARLNTNGGLDNSFDPGTGANDIVFSTAIQSDGKIIICGFFTSYNGTVRNRIARINTDGSLDTSFNPGTGANSGISNISIQNDGKIIIVGDFTSYNGTSRNHIARLNTNGSIDTFFNPGTGASNFVSSTAIQSDGKIIICGTFTSYNGTVANHIARLNTDASLDTSFNTGTGANDTIFLNTSIQNDGKIIIGGAFTSYNGTGRNLIARINGGAALSNPSFDISTTVIYPNPSNGNFNVKIDDLIGTENIEVYSVLGQKIYSKSIVENESSVDLSNQPKGIYFYKISNNNNEIKSGKLIIE